MRAGEPLRLQGEEQRTTLKGPREDTVSALLTSHRRSSTASRRRRSKLSSAHSCRTAVAVPSSARPKITTSDWSVPIESVFAYWSTPSKRRWYEMVWDGMSWCLWSHASARCSARGLCGGTRRSQRDSCRYQGTYVITCCSKKKRRGRRLIATRLGGGCILGAAYRRCRVPERR